MSEVKVNKISPRSGTAFTLGDSGDTFTVPSGAGLTLTDSTLLLPTTINTDKLDPKSGTDLELGSSGDTITIPSGATITNSGTATGFSNAGEPYFQATMSTAAQTLSDASAAKVAFNVASIDSGSTYDTTNFRWTPAVVGKYFISASVLGYGPGDSQLQTISMTFNKNDSIIFYFGNADNRTSYPRGKGCTGSILVELDADDYIEVFATVNTVDGGAPTVNGESTQTWFNGFRIA